MTAPEPHAAAPEVVLTSERCPGCGSVVSDRFQSCRPVSVDVTQPGYRYLADLWGYCLHLGRHIGTDETPWLAAQAAEHEREVAELEAECLREHRVREHSHRQRVAADFERDEARRDLADLRGRLADEAERATERAYFQIAVEKSLTIECVGIPGTDARARVPGHWRDEAEGRASVPVAALRAILASEPRP